MSTQYLGYGVSVQRSDVVWPLIEWGTDYFESDRLTFIGLSLPILVLGVYVTVVGAGVSADLRDEKLRAVTAQGARRRTILKYLTFESMIVGLVASVLGLVLGILMSRVLLDPVAAWHAWIYDYRVTSSDYAVSTFTILLVVGLGVAVTFIAALFASLRATRPPRTGPSEFDVLRILPIAEVIIIGLSLASVFAILGGQRWVGSHGFDWFFGSAGAFFDHFGLVIFPAVPFMLSLAFANLLTKWPVSAHKRFAKTLFGIGPTVPVPRGPMTDRCEKRARRMCVLVALTLALAVFLTIAMDTMVADEAGGDYEDQEATALSEFLFVEMFAAMIIMVFGVAAASYANARARP